MQVCLCVLVSGFKLCEPPAESLLSIPHAQKSNKAAVQEEHGSTHVLGEAFPLSVQGF